MNVIDLFAGAGGFSAGFKRAGYNIILANEIDKQIAYTYQKNFKDTLMINEDIQNLAENFDELVNQNLAENFSNKEEILQGLQNIDVVIGGPPCQGFSMAGGRIRKKNAFLEDPRNYLFKFYFKIIQRFEPKYFVIENVPGMKSLKNGLILEEIINTFEDESNFKNGRYYLTTKVVSADEFGVPQARKRFIIIGSKFAEVDMDMGLKVVKRNMQLIDKKRFEKNTLYDAISDLNYLEHSEGSIEQDYLLEPVSYYQLARRSNSETLYNHIASKHNDIALSRIKQIKPGQNYKDLKDVEKIKSVHSGSYGRLEWNKVAMTITTRFDTPSAGRVIHPERHRALTPREAARIQSFDDDFIFYGNKTSIGTQIGNAVPPLLAEVLGNLIKYDYEMLSKDKKYTELQTVDI
ncbi:DNA cytosine methyltransferase [Ornithinibacillus halophilus]|uniref:Cytosine-specific methyltransferase n=1 Tax=Ornithinibacillus halophilus TaxID=930117 RepID=A0A1M5G2X5_9BACI|nr:DNA cytosine methyltransferase [Ornithinibacillus halophilus]SHF98088.1 DNA (cytosine-5)-methyltransferase 1 [Ornithinibacillus halophilus]